MPFEELIEELSVELFVDVSGWRGRFGQFGRREGFGRQGETA